ncbi:hypothetical protein A7C91_02785 [Thermococcus piezophilus]|uniref:Uncharacterized protein n=1 Tax=Thermococcus piezophilus TaxID=1712654 RepID=A0A172WFL4_9EURY|nr:hypothetical protein A7C91_02785 [Thermococcus piezophilus]
MFNTAKSGLLRKKSTEITSPKSFPLEGIKEISIQITNDTFSLYYIRMRARDANHDIVFSIGINPKIGRSDLRKVYSILWTTFEGLSKRYKTDAKRNSNILFLDQYQ